MMRVLIVQPWIRVGGGELLGLHLAAELERLGHEVTLAALFVDARGLPPELLARRYVLPPRPLRALFQRQRLAALTLGVPMLVGLVLRASAAADVLNPHNLPAPLAAAVAGALRRRPIVWQVNEVPEPPRRDDRAITPIERALWAVGALLARAVARVPRTIVVLAERTRRDVRERYGRDAVVVRPGVDAASFSPGERRSRDDTVRVLSVAKLHPQKDPLRAVRVARILADRGHDVALTIVGSGPLEREVRAAVATSLPGRARLIGRADAPELAQLYRHHDVLLVTADERQSWGLTPFEALACGTPAVIPSDIGAAELLCEARAAVCVPRADDAMADAVERLTREDAERADLLARGRDVVRTLTWQRFAARYAELLRDAL